MFPTHLKREPANIPVKIAIHASYAVTTAAASALIKNPASVKNIRKIRGATMNRLSCYFERLSDFALGLFLLFTGLAFTVIGFTIFPVIGLFIAIPVLLLAVAFLGAKKSKECALIAQRTKGIFSS